jgi:uncharacterized protein
MMSSSLPAMLRDRVTAVSMEDIKVFARDSFSSARGSHDWDHTERVYRLCMRLADAEGADREIVAIAAFLHDVGRPYQDESRGAICHAEKGAEIAEALLHDYPLSPDKKRDIVHCIRTHRFRGNRRPETLEAKILFDADKLDAIGAVGVARAFLFAGEVGARLHNPHMSPEEAEPYSKEDTGFREFKLKLSRIKDCMMTKEGKRIAADRHAFMESFFHRFLEEYEGEM